MAIAAATPELENVVAEAARAAGVSVAFVGFVEKSGESVRAARGWNVALIPPAVSFAIRIANQSDVVVVPDTTRDERFSTHPMVTGAPNIRFYAGVPIFDDGAFVGALSIIDRAPRELTSEQIAMLRLLGKCISREMQYRRGQEELNERFGEFFEQTDDLIMSLGPDLRLVHCNDAVPNMLGFSRQELWADSLISFVAPEERDEFRRVAGRVFEHGEPLTLETIFVTSAGRRLTVEGSLRPRVIDGRAVMVRVIFRDITDRKEYESELGNARDAALEAARLKTQFLTNISHEIRTPMNGIIGMLDLLESTALNEEQRDYAGQATANAHHLLAMVNNILHVSSVEAGGLGTENVAFDVRKTLQRVVDVMAVAALGKDVEVRFVYGSELPPILRGNQGRLRQAVTNLMENAVKFTEQGRVSLQVSQQTETDSHRVVRFEIQDTGVGISEPNRRKLFEAFTQLDGSQTRQYQGSGLGLATARQLVETMGGLMDVESKPGIGSTFWFTVPFPKQPQGQNPIASSALEFQGKRVLLVDSQPVSRKIVQHYLEASWGMRVEVAETGAAALALARQAAEADPFRVVIFDRMPDIDAFSFAGEIHSDSRLTGCSLIYLPVASSEVNRERMREAGIDAFVLKPVGQTELFDAMTVALAHDALLIPRNAGSGGASPAGPVVPSPEMRQKVRVLLAEDNFLNAKLTLSQLQKLGYRADSVPNGKEAVEAVASNDYQIVLMDCQMPVYDGYRATIEIRRMDRERGAKRRIIAMTANALEGDREKCLAAGMDDYLAKPTKHEDLEAALNRYFASLPSRAVPS